MNILFAIAKFIMRPVIRIFFGAKCIGAEKLPKSGGVIIAANHIHALDPLFMAIFTKRDFHCLAKKELFKNRLFGKLLVSAGMIPVDRARVSRETIDDALSVLGENNVLCIFPQGTRHKGENPRQTQIKNGVGMFAYHSKMPVVPVSITAKDMKPRLFRRTLVRFGDPITYDELGFEKGSVDEFRKSSEYIFNKICALGESEVSK